MQKLFSLLIASCLAATLSAQNCVDIDFSHLQPVYDLECVPLPLELAAVPDGFPPATDIEWALNGSIFSNSNSIVASIPGIYSLTMTSATDCTDTYTFEVIEQGLGLLPNQVFLQGCLEPGLDTIWALSWWNDTYTYNWSDGGTGFMRNDLVMDESYDITITTPGGCEAVTTINVPFLIGLLLDIEVIESNGCAPNKIAINIYDDIGLPTYSVNINSFNPPGQNYTFFLEDYGPDTFDILPGNYSADAFSFLSGCGTNDFYSFTVEGFTSFWDYEITTCDGEPFDLAIVPFGGTAPFTYNWSTGNTTDSLINISQVGDYRVTITDADGCTTIDSITIEDWTVTITNGFELAQPSCGNEDGQMAANPGGGLQPYTYEWSNGATTQILNDLAPGTYTVTITDANNCTGEFTQEVVATLDGLIDYTVKDGTGGCGNTSAWLVPINFDPTLTYSWIGPGFNGVVADSIFVTQSALYALFGFYDNDCSGNITRQVTLQEPLTGQIDAQNVNCNPYTILEVAYSQGVNPNQIDHQWLLPDGSTAFSTSPSLFAFSPGQYIYQGTQAFTGCLITDTIFLPTVGQECPIAAGTLWADEGNCMLDGTELAVANWSVQIMATDGSITEVLPTNADGEFAVNLPTGDYVVTPIIYNNDLYTNCPSPQILTVAPDGSGYIDVFMPYVEECASMYVNVTAPFLRRCFSSPAYVRYCNDGPVTAENAQVIVELDEFLDYQSSNVPVSSVDGNTLTFNIGDLAPYECGTIALTLFTSCEAVLGQTHCIEATATPNDPCPAPNDWSGANVSLSGECVDGELQFFITNDGNAAMTQALEYIVIQDGVMLMGGTVTVPALTAGQTFEVPALQANGQTFHLQTNQEPGNPFFGTPTLAVEGCGTNQSGSFTTGMVNQLPYGDSDVSWFDVFCRENIGAYDPNEKVGLPLGVGTPHYIDPGTLISYDIQFQNTGTDTAFTVVILDTIAPEFDLTTLRMGVSSHDYTYEVDSNRALIITFNNIMLPDSNVDLRGSQGVVSYTITHLADVPLETELRNQAAIYFDYNEPIYTSNTLHTLGEDFLSSLVPAGQFTQIPMTVFPNPADRYEALHISLDYQEAYQIEIYDALGRVVLRKNHLNGNAQIDLSKQAPGWYVARALDNNGNFLSLKRFVIE